VVALLKTHKAAQNEERLRAGDLWEESGCVFTTAFGKPGEPHNLLRAVRIASGKAGLSGVTVHTLRHTYATTALMAGVPLKVVSVNMGHASIQITADTYVHVSDEASQEAARRVSDAFDAFGP
jgi:integrase